MPRYGGGAPRPCPYPAREQTHQKTLDWEEYTTAVVDEICDQILAKLNTIQRAKTSATHDVKTPSKSSTDAPTILEAKKADSASTAAATQVEAMLHATLPPVPATNPATNVSCASK